MPVASRLARNLTLAVVTAETAPVVLEAGDGKVIETSLGGKVEIPFKVTKREAIKGNLKVSAVDLPRDINRKDENIKDNGKTELYLRSTNIPTGTYSFYFQGSPSSPTSGIRRPSIKPRKSKNARTNSRRSTTRKPKPPRPKPKRRRRILRRRHRIEVRTTNRRGCQEDRGRSGEGRRRSGAETRRSQKSRRRRQGRCRQSPSRTASGERIGGA